jgi:superoxide reductase
MKTRRQFLKTALITGSAVALSHTRKVSASGGGDLPGIVYTRDNPGRWVKKVGSHAPKVSVKGQTVTIRTAHPMSERHYIVRHTLVSADGKVLGEKTFYPTDKTALSSYQLPENAGTHFYATSFCNLHDFWMTEFSV